MVTYTVQTAGEEYKHPPSVYAISNYKFPDLSDF
jgi:hypothetical protein